MLASFVITFRETLEVALITGIILSYLIQTKQEKYNNVVYVGITSGIIASLIGAFFFTSVAGGFEGTTEEIFEGMTMIFGAVLITTMILWMMHQKQLALKIRKEVQAQLENASRIGLFLLVFVSVLREGIETVIFLGAASFVDADLDFLLGAFGGIVAATILGVILFVGSKKINIKTFFTITSILLILFAAGLMAHGIHELQEAHVIIFLGETAWDINPPVNADGSYPELHEKGLLGSFFKQLFGYNGNPTVLEVIVYAVYLLLVFVGIKKFEKKN